MLSSNTPFAHYTDKECAALESLGFYWSSHEWYCDDTRRYGHIIYMTVQKIEVSGNFELYVNYGFDMNLGHERFDYEIFGSVKKLVNHLS